MYGIESRCYVQVQIWGMQLKIQNGGTADTRKINLRILAFMHIKGLGIEYASNMILLLLFGA